jgi:mono/diheme cytochrome c family protein
MNPNFLPRIAFIVTCMVLMALLSSCGNMKKQRNLRTFDPSRQFSDGSSARNAPAHTVSRGGSLRPGGKAFDDDQLELVTESPIPLTADLLARGQARYDIYCAVCHGPDGYGSGIVVRRGFPNPPSFHDDRLRRANLGHFVNVITHGYGVMYPYIDRVPEEDRWAIAVYIRALQRSQHASLADLPPDEAKRLSEP